MKVKELIAELQKLDGELPVLIYEAGDVRNYIKITSVEVCKTMIQNRDASGRYPGEYCDNIRHIPDPRGVNMYGWIEDGYYKEDMKDKQFSAIIIE